MRHMQLPLVSTLAIAALVLASVAMPARAETVMLSPSDDVEAAIAAAQPGDELILAGGTYELTERFGITAQGTADAPIVIRAADGERPVFHRAAQDQNVIDVDDARHLVLRGLVISGGSHGLRLVSASFVTVEACEIHDTGDVALSANSGGRYEALQILGNHIHDTHGTGEGMYLGCNDDGCQVFDSLIAGNYVHDTDDASVEQGDGIELKEGSYNNVIRDNVIHDTHYPCILTYSTAGNGAPNVIEGNVMWGCGDHGIQSAADAVIRNNVILGAAADGIALQPHQSGAPAELVVVHNTVLAPANDAISVSGLVGMLVIANNALYAEQGNALRVAGDLSQLVVAGNVGQGVLDGPASGFAAGGTLDVDFIAARFSGAVPNEVFPAVGSALIAAGAVDYVPERDFNGTLRNGIADVGAYAFDAGGNPGAELAAAPKDATFIPANPPDAGAPSPGGSGGMAGGGSGGRGGGGATGGTAGSAGASSLRPAGQGAGGAAGASPAPTQASGSHADRGGCSCRAVRSGGDRAGMVAALAALLVAARIRRRKRSVLRATLRRGDHGA
jgi:MYXO-CTERM domain-containing protein